METDLLEVIPARPKVRVVFSDGVSEEVVFKVKLLSSSADIEFILIIVVGKETITSPVAPETDT